MQIRQYGIRWLPGLLTLRDYRATWLTHDIVAGIVLATMLVPVGIAYAVASGVPGINGLYATIIPLLAYALFGPSRIMVLGPDSSLAAVVTEGTVGAGILTILSKLRNTVHEAGLPALAIGLPGRREGTLIGLPRADKDRILAAARRQGGLESWGLREILPGRLHAEPGVLLERLLPAVIELLNELMTGTLVGTLSGASLKDGGSATRTPRRRLRRTSAAQHLLAARAVEGRGVAGDAGGRGAREMLVITPAMRTQLAKVQQGCGV